jgi:hypothetical protein
MLFFDYRNAQHPNISFTFEKQANGKLPFLDVLIDNSSNTCITSVFHKKTYTGLLTNFLSFTPFTYKIGLIRTLIDRTFKLNSTDNGLHKDLKQLTNTLERNSFPSHIIDKVSQQYLNKSKSNNSLSNSDSTVETNTRYFKLPYIGNYSKATELKIKSLLKRFCSDLNIKLVFSSYKIKNLFGFKDPIPDALKSLVVYKFTCAGCNSRYIGETSRHFTTRIKEHTITDKTSHNFKHLNNSSNCKDQYSSTCITILYSAKTSSKTSSSLKLKESFYINKEKPELNKQVQHVNTFLSL